MSIRQAALNKQLIQLARALGISETDTWSLPPKYSKQSVALSRRISAQIRQACPLLSAETSANFATDIADLWEVGRYHEKFIHDFLRLRFPKDRTRLEDLLITWVEIQLLTHCQWHLKSLKKISPRILSAINVSPTKNVRFRKSAKFGTHSDINSQNSTQKRK